MKLNITINNSTVTINTPSQHTVAIEKLIETSNITTCKESQSIQVLEQTVREELLRAIASASQVSTDNLATESVKEKI